MAGMYELFSDDEDMGVRFRITAPDGTVMAVSRSFPDKQAAVAGIEAVRAYAGTGHITDLCPEVPLNGKPTPPVTSGTAPPARKPPYLRTAAWLPAASSRQPMPRIHRTLWP
ncbi:YegP family protein [Arthrobacter sp. ISL-65]|uniref:YegP family protein n=1 Tax=Arthrobacter sp. ISL-65 TaxID=2819112 RepID=UPI001BEA7AF5|nr:YegP family protein [Arthrobacter sp. ISL-65]MBT2550434.1 YegP family protein [Arthrobacter sp. ISL-65]